MESAGGRQLEYRIGPVAVASISGAVGSLPLHLLPLIVTTLLIDGTLSVAGVGWVPAALLIGQLSTSVLLPSCRITKVSAGTAIAAAIAMQVGLVIANSTDLATILLGWFVVGQSCGILRYLSTVTLASADARPFAFGIRLASVLIFASIVILALQSGANFGGYHQFVGMLQILLLPALLVTVLTTRPMSIKQTDESAKRASQEEATARPFLTRLSGLAVIFLFFLGQTGFLAYAFQQAEGRGVAIEDVITAAVVMKLVAGTWLFVHCLTGQQSQSGLGLAALAAAVVIAMIAVTFSATLAALLIGLVVYEIALNTLSAQLQSAVVSRDPLLAGPWLNSAIMFGAAAGPPLNGFAIALDSASVFLAVALVSAFLPILWQRGVRLDANLLRRP